MLRAAIFAGFALTGCHVTGWQPDQGRRPDASSISIGFDAGGCEEGVGQYAGIDSAQRQLACKQPIDIATTIPTQGGSAAVPLCTLDEDGSVVLEYADTQCSADQATPYRGCEFAWHQNLMPFDPMHGHGGAYEIFFCVEGPVNGAVNVWYQQGDCETCRNSLPLLAGDESLLGCRKVYVAPEDVGRNVPWQPGPYCASRDSSTGACMNSPDSGLAVEPNVDAATTGLASDAGSVDSPLDAADMQSRPDFGDSMLVLMNEWCDPGKSDAPDGGIARITLKSVVYHPDGCLCTYDSECADGQFCQSIAWPSRACCACSGCPGLCQ